MPNKRISDLSEREILFSDSAVEPFPSSARIEEPSIGDRNTFFLLARPKIRNEKISYSNLKSSILDNSVYLTGQQLISGSKTFSEPCTFLSRINVNEAIDITETGDISGNIFVGDSGLYENLGVGSNFFKRNSGTDNTLDISGDFCFIGDTTQTGSRRQVGNLLQIGNISLSGDFHITGNSFYTGDISQIGDALQIGFYHQVGNDIIIGDTDIIGDITQTGDSFLTGNASRVGDTNLVGEYDISGSSFALGDTFHSGFLNCIGDSTQTGDFYFKGDRTAGDLFTSGISFVEDLFAYDEEFNKQFYKVFGGDDETVTFKTHLRMGSDEFKINFPKTFKTHPVISINLEHENGGIIPSAIISDVTPHDFIVKLGAPLSDQGYYLHTTALTPSILNEVNGIHYEEHPFVTCSDHGQNRHGIQRFYTRLQNDADEHEIFFPFGYKDVPAVTLTIEGPNKIIPYAISSVNNNSYTIIFGTNVNQDYTIHTFSSFEGTKRLG